MTANAAVRVSGQVLSVRPRMDGTFGVTVGPGPTLHWYVAREPPKLGTEVNLQGYPAASQPVQWRDQRGTVVVLKDVAVQLASMAYATRYVAPEWKKRIQAVMRRPLYRYQVDGASWLASRLASAKGAILGDDPGLGKSPQTIAALAATRMFPAIIVCPMSVKINWAREFQWTHADPVISIISKKHGPIAPGDVYIINHDLIPAREQQLGNLFARCLVLDEAQAFKKQRPEQRHRAAVATRLASWIGRTILLTGTPVLNRPRDLWRLLHIVDPAEWHSFEEFDQRYCKPPPEDEAPQLPARNIVTQHGRVENLDELHARVEPILLRRLKGEVLPDLPPKSRRQLLVEIDEHDMHTYRAAEEDILSWMRAQQYEHERTRAAARAQAIVKLTMLRHLAAQFKMRRAVPDYLWQWFDRTRVEPLIVFAFHTDVILGNDPSRRYLYNECVRILGPERVSIIGSGDSMAKRQVAVDAFNEGRTDVFIAPIRCAGVGLNLQERCTDTFFVERLWEPAWMTQAEDRVHRIGQMRPVTATYMDAAGTIDEYIAEINQAKQTLISHTLDDRVLASEALAVTDELVDRYRRNR